MFQRPLGLAAVALFAALTLAGCSKSTTAPGTAQSQDQVQVSNTLTASASLVDDGLAEDPSQVPAAATADSPKGPVTETAIRPLTWWQHVTQESRTWTFAFSDSDSTGRPRTCVATLVKHMTGSLVIVPQDPNDSTVGSATHITKPLDKTWTRKVLLQRIPVAGTPLWRIAGLTGAFVTTPAAVTQLVSLHLHSTSGVDTTITDPLQFFSLRHVIAFTEQDTVTVTARTLRADDAVFIHRWDWRHRLHDNGDDTYSWTWVTSPWGGWRHFGIQAMSHGSLYDDTLPFDSQAWHLPFRVIGQQPPVDYYP